MDNAAKRNTSFFIELFYWFFLFNSQSDLTITNNTHTYVKVMSLHTYTGTSSALAD